MCSRADLNKADSKDGATAVYRAAAGELTLLIMPKWLILYYYYCSGGHRQTLLWLLAHRANASRPTKNRSTPLHAAAQAYMEALANGFTSQVALLCSAEFGAFYKKWLLYVYIYIYVYIYLYMYIKRTFMF
jgi:hypothetical protein